MKKTIDLFFGHLGNGLTVCDKNREERGDYLKIAHISENGEIKFYQEIPDKEKSSIEQMAWTTYGRKHYITQEAYKLLNNQNKIYLIEKPDNNEPFATHHIKHPNESYTVSFYSNALYPKQTYISYTINESEQ